MNTKMLLNSRCRNFAFVVAIAALSAVSADAKNIYVSALANGDGSESSPYKTIGQAASAASPGDVILVSAGTYSEKNIVPAKSGTENAMIVFRPKTEKDVVVIKHPASNSSDNTPIFDLSNRSYIQIEGFSFKDFTYGKACIYISNGVGNFVINNKFENLGNKEVGSWDGNQMVGLFNSQKNVVCNNYFNNNFGDGINVNSSKTKENLVCNNTFIGFKGKLRSWGGSYLYSRAIDIQDMSQGNNVIAFNSSNKGINHVWMDRNGSGNVILRNFGVDGGGLVFNESRCSTNVVQENIAVRMGSGFMTAYYSGTGDSYKGRYINNVSYQSDYGFKMSKTEKDEVRNNIIFNSKNYNIGFTQTAANAGPYTFSNNLWFTSGKSNSMQYKGSGTSVSNFQNGVGEKNGLSLDPQFANVNNNDFTLSDKSPAKGKGDNGYDLGAYPVYGPSPTGWNSSYKFADQFVYFESAISSADRNGCQKLNIRLNKATSNPVTVYMEPVAGDAKLDVDFAMRKKVTFAAGETTKSAEVCFGGSGKYDELVAFRLQEATNASVGARNLHTVRLKAGSGKAVEPMIEEPEDTTSVADSLKTGGSTTVIGSIPAHTQDLKLITNSGKLQIEGATEQSDVVIQNLQGRIVRTGRGNEIFDLGKHSGVLLVSVKNPNGKWLHFRTIINIAR